jgi:hypothetical protein
METFAQRGQRMKFSSMTASLSVLFSGFILSSCKHNAGSSNVFDEGQFLHTKPPGVSDAVIDAIKAATIGGNGSINLPGTGFYITDDYLALTNYHVVYPCIKDHYDEIPVSTNPIKLQQPVQCGNYSVVALPPDPFQRTQRSS